MTGIDEMFAEFQGNTLEEYQLDLFCWVMREQHRRRESHRERQRIAQRLVPVVHRRAKNVQRRDYWRDYRRKQRASDPALVARDREAARLRMARLREARAA